MQVRLRETTARSQEPKADCSGLELRQLPRCDAGVDPIFSVLEGTTAGAVKASLDETGLKVAVGLVWMSRPQRKRRDSELLTSLLETGLQFGRGYLFGKWYQAAQAMLLINSEARGAAAEYCCLATPAPLSAIIVHTHSSRNFNLH